MLDDEMDAAEDTPVRVLMSVVIGLVAIAVVILAVWLQMPTGGTPKSYRDERQCKAHLKQIGLACMIYASENDDAFPFADGGSLKSLSLLLGEYLEPDQVKVLVCPSTEDVPMGPDTDSLLVDTMFSYEYLPGVLGTPLDMDAPGDLILAYDKTVAHRRTDISNSVPGRIVLSADCTVERMTEADFQARLEKDKLRYERIALAGMPVPALPKEWPLPRE